MTLCFLAEDVTPMTFAAFFLSQNNNFFLSGWNFLPDTFYLDISRNQADLFEIDQSDSLNQWNGKFADKSLLSDSVILNRVRSHFNIPFKLHSFFTTHDQYMHWEQIYNIQLLSFFFLFLPTFRMLSFQSCV